MFNFNHKKIETAIKGKGIDEHTLFHSRSYLEYLQKIARNISRNYDLTVKFDINSNTAYTDGKRIAINPFLDMLKGFPLTQKTLINMGFLAHELFHILFTDFSVLHTLVADKAKYKYFSIIKNIFNIVEDSSIELYGTNYYTGDFRTAVIFLNDTIYSQSGDVEDVDNKLNQIMSMMCNFGSVGRIKGDSTKLSQDVQDAWEIIKPLMKKGRYSQSTEERKDITLTIYKIMIPIIEETYKEYKENQPKTDNFMSSGEQQGEPMEISQDFHEDLNPNEKKDDEKEDQNSDDSQSSSEDDNKEGTGKKSKKSSDKDEEKDAEKDEKAEKNENEKGSEDGDSKSDAENKDDEKSQGQGQEKDKEENNDDQESDKSSDNANSDDEGNKDKSENENVEGSENTQKSNTEADDSTDKNEEQDKDSQSTGTDIDGGEDNKSKDENAKTDGEDDVKEIVTPTPEEVAEKLKEQLEAKLKGIENDLNRVEEDVITEKTEDAITDMKNREISSIMSGTKYGTVNSRITTQNSFLSNSRLYSDSFNIVHDQVKLIVKNISNQLKKILRFQQDETSTGHRIGTLAVSQVTRVFTDGKVFQRNKDKSKVELAITVMVDLSGSMEENNRLYYAKEACITLIEVCRNLNIPISVIGHRAGYMQDNVYHFHAFDFDSPEKDKFNIMQFSADHNTREGVSLRYCGEYMAKRRDEETKLIIAISDGEPMHGGRSDVYEGKVAQDDTKKAIAELEKKGVKVFGVNIGGGSVHLKDFYKLCIDVPNTKELPAKLIGILKKNFLK